MSLSNYFLIISLVLNSALLMAVLGPLPFLLYLSVVLIVAMVWYIKRLIENISNMTQDIEELLDAVYSLETHMRGLYSLETFYGDPTLEDLINHTKEVVDEIDFFRDKYALSVEDLEEEELDAIIEEDIQTETTKESE
jgi:flagellar motor component MotA